MGKRLLLIAALLLSGCVSLPPPAGNYSSIHTFEECAAAGYPVMESYPRQCRTPDGHVFLSQKDLFSINKNASCGKDEDCVLADSGLGFACCYAGACEAVDYSLDKWVAVNGAWYGSAKSSYCPASESCGPAPGCFPRPINENYTARCVLGKCEKAPTGTCSSDAGCAPGFSCWYRLPAGPSAGIRGSAESPGTCWDDRVISELA